MYDPTIGRWISVDPQGFEEGDTNLYRYVQNSPTNYTDPSGHHLILAKNYDLPKQYLNWLRGGKDNIFSKAFGGTPGPGLTDKEVVARTLPNGKVMLLVLHGKTVTKIQEVAGKYKGTKNLQASLYFLAEPGNSQWYLKEDAAGPYTLDGKKLKLSGQAPEDPTKGGQPWLEWIQEWVNTGGNRERTDEVSGPNVTEWFARDLVAHMKHRAEHNSPVPVISLYQMQHQAADLMAPKWIDFGGPARGRGVATVVLGKKVMSRNELGNIELMVAMSIWPPSGLDNFMGATSLWTGAQTLKELGGTVMLRMGLEDVVDPARKRVLGYAPGRDKATVVAQLGYAIIPNYRKPYFLTFDDNQFLWRADNLVAFGAGNAIARRFLEKINKNPVAARKQVEKDFKSREGLVKLTRIMTNVLNEFFGGDAAANKRLSDAARLYAKLQPGAQWSKITSEALSFTPEYGGFNFNSLQLSKDSVTSAETSIAVAGIILRKYREYANRMKKEKKTPVSFSQWRIEQYEDYTKKGGVPID